MKNIRPCIAFFLSSCMMPPQQPKLTQKEVNYFQELQTSCGCNVKREINPYITKEKNDSSKDGNYLVLFDSLDYQILERDDSLRNASRLIARKIMKEILDETFKNSHEKIIVAYECYTGPSGYRTKTFDFYIKDLE